jgi:cytochrome c-type biogenesis protein CcmF
VGFAIVLGLAVMLGLYGDRSVLGPVGVVLGLWIAVSALIDPVDRWRRGLSVSPAILGMTLAHIGLGVVTIGLTTMESRRMERDVALSPGQQVQVGRYTFRFLDTQQVEGPNYTATRAHRTVPRRQAGVHPAARAPQLLGAAAVAGRGRGGRELAS